LSELCSIALFSSSQGGLPEPSLYEDTNAHLQCGWIKLLQMLNLELEPHQWQSSGTVMILHGIR